MEVSKSNLGADTLAVGEGWHVVDGIFFAWQITGIVDFHAQVIPCEQDSRPSHGTSLQKQVTSLVALYFSKQAGFFLTKIQVALLGCCYAAWVGIVLSYAIAWGSKTALKYAKRGTVMHNSLVKMLLLNAINMSAK